LGNIDPVAHLLGGRKHGLRDHLESVAKLASDMAASFRAHDWTYLAGLWHDVGKYSKEFQNRIRAAQGLDAHIETVGKVDHSTAGAQHAFTFLRNDVGKVLAYLFAG
jgi:CRISPR-associated endonuclease/helicase Cas3